MLRSSVNIHSQAYLITLIIIAASIPLSKFTMSIGQFLLLALWLWAGFSFRIAFRFFNISGPFMGIFHLFGYLGRLAYNNFIDKITLFFKNKAAVVLWSIYVIHVVGLIYTADMDYALKDLRIKLPLLLFPVILSTMYTINYRDFKILMRFYVAAVFVGSLISFGLILKGDFTDIRDISPFVGSIRFGLNVSFSLFILLYFIIKDKSSKKWQKMVFIFVAIWFIVFLILMESMTSLSIIIVVGLVYLILRLLKTKNIALRIVIGVFVIGIPLSIYFYVADVVKSASTAPEIDFANLEVTSSLGNEYWHDTITRGVEDGKYVGLYICEIELEKSWNERSDHEYRSNTHGGHDIKETLIRYLTSLNLRKDASGVEGLDDKDIQMIEYGVANVHYVENPGIRVRILKILKGYEVYQKTGDPSGSSVMQRIEYSKGSLKLIKENFWFGVGTGDIENSLIKQYKDMNSELKSEFMFHAHNQYFAVFITFGVFGFLWFIFSIVYPPYVLGRFSDFFFLSFFLIITLSMFSDDTLETQAGVTLFAFFYAFLLFTKKQGNAI